MGEFVVGANFPWVRCGWDFGPPPPGWTRPDDWERVARELAGLRALGIDVVRWWLLAGGVNYPVGRAITELARAEPDLLGRPHHYRLRVGAHLPALPEPFLRDVERLLRLAREAGVRLVPSLVSFEWFDRIRDGHRGRHELVFGGPGDDPRVAVGQFFAATLEPLLAVAAPFRDAIYAFELVNEPDWVVQGGPPNPRVRKLVRPGAMRAFLAEGLARIERAGLCATVGFKQAAPRWVDDALWSVLRAAAARGRYVHQLHHYPNALGERWLPRAAHSPVAPVLVGELPTSDRFSLTNARWLDRAARERAGTRYLEARLAVIRDQGYAGALLWATEPAFLADERVARGGARELDGHTLWGERQRQQVRRFTAARPLVG